jgi:imidazolonepropionase
MLRVARRIGREAGVRVRTSYLGLHAVPPEWKADRGRYLDLAVDDILPAAHAEGLVDAVDAYCEPIAFSTGEVGRLFDRAKALGLPVKLHADQLSDGGGAALAAKYGALSADHIEHTGEAGVRAMAEAGVVHFVEFGGKILSPMVKRSAGEDISTSTVISMDDIEALLKDI